MLALEFAKADTPSSLIQAQNMNGLLIATSIYPPSLKREDKDGNDIGASYFKSCKASWAEAGFHWLTVNRETELSLLDDFAPDVQRQSCDDTGAISPGRYGPTVGALYEATASQSIAGICNADTFVMRGANAAHIVKGAAAGNFIMARRTEVDGWGGPLHSVNSKGIDAIFFDREAFKAVFTHPVISRFQMGMPWWDIVVPVAASFHAPLLQIREPWLMHLRHNQAWNGGQNTALGKEARDCIIDYAEEMSDTSERARQFLLRYRSVVADPSKLKLRKQVNLFSDVCRAWLWNDTHPRVLELAIDGDDLMFRKSLDATIFQKPRAESKLQELGNDAGPGEIMNGLLFDMKRILQLGGRHIERWARHRIRRVS